MIDYESKARELVGKLGAAFCKGAEKQDACSTCTAVIALCATTLRETALEAGARPLALPKGVMVVAVDLYEALQAVADGAARAAACTCGRSDCPEIAEYQRARSRLAAVRAASRSAETRGAGTPPDRASHGAASVGSSADRLAGSEDA